MEKCCVAIAPLTQFLQGRLCHGSEIRATGGLRREGTGHGGHGHTGGSGGAARPGHRRCSVPAAARGGGAGWAGGAAVRRGGGSLPGGGGQRAPTWAVCDSEGRSDPCVPSTLGSPFASGPPTFHSRPPTFISGPPVHSRAARSLQPPRHCSPNHCRGAPPSADPPSIRSHPYPVQSPPPFVDPPHLAQKPLYCAEPPILCRTPHLP